MVTVRRHSGCRRSSTSYTDTTVPYLPQMAAAHITGSSASMLRHDWRSHRNRNADAAWSPKAAWKDYVELDPSALFIDSDQPR